MRHNEFNGLLKVNFDLNFALSPTKCSALSIAFSTARTKMISSDNQQFSHSLGKWPIATVLDTLADVVCPIDRLRLRTSVSPNNFALFFTLYIILSSLPAGPIAIAILSNPNDSFEKA
jgi:hypothetical protein